MADLTNDGRALPAIIAAFLAFSPVGMAMAADDTDVLQEVVVTALRREQDANKVGVAVSVLTGDTLQSLGIRGTEDVVATLPNVVMTSIFGPGTNPNWSIRGITSNDYNDATEAPIAAYIDDVYLVSTGAGSTPFYDMARVEVLRGPQGTLFGRNSTGGAVQFISNEPNGTQSGAASYEYGSYNTNRFQGYVNVPLTGNLQVRLAGYYSTNNGFMPNVTGKQPDAGQRITQAFRGQLAFEPNDSIRDVVKLSYSNSYGHTTGIWHDHITLNPEGQLVPAPGPDTIGQPPQYGWYGYNGQDRELKAAQNYLAINKLEWKLNDTANLTSITAYDHYMRDVIEDCDGGALWECSTHYRNPSYQYSQELRLFIDRGAQRYTLGAYGLYQFVDIHHVAPLTVQAADGSITGGVGLIVRGAQHANGEAVFVNGEFDLGSRFTLIAGVRESQDRKHLWHDYKVVLPVDPANPWPTYTLTPDVPYGQVLSDNAFNDQNSGGANRFTKNLTSGKIELDFKPVEGNLAYISYSRGTKAPGYNNGFIFGGLQPNQYFYDAEKLDAFELGDKASLFDRHVQLNTDVYYYKYNNYDILNYQGVGSYILNGDARTYGFEFDLTAKPIEHLYVSANGSIAHSILYNISNTGGVMSDNQMPLLPKVTLFARIGYELPVAGSRVAGVELDERATSYMYNNPQNDPAARIPGYAVTNGRAYFANEDRKWELSVNVKNLFNRLYSTQIFALYGINQARYGFYGDPRWVTVQLQYKF